MSLEILSCEFDDDNARGVVVAREVRDAIGGVGTQMPSPGSIPGARFQPSPDFGLIRALPLAIAFGLLFWATVIALFQ
jgi:hypothetical protein